MTLKTDIAWAAGFFDGEGTININYAGGYGSRRRKKEHSGTFIHMIGATQVRRAPLDKLKTLFGGTVHYYEYGSRKSKSGRSAFHVWRLQGIDAILSALVLMLPYLTCKQAEAELMISYCEHMKTVGRPGRKGHSEEEIARRHDFSLKLKALR